jgi:hypothetical protein
MKEKATNLLYAKVLDLLTFVFIVLFLSYILVPLVGDTEDCIDYFEPVGGLYSMTGLCVGSGLSIVLRVSGESGEPLDDKAGGTLDVSRLSKSNIIGDGGNLAGYALTLAGFIWSVYGRIGGADQLAGGIGVGFLIAGLLLISYLYPVVREGGLLRSGLGLFYLLLGLPECNASSINPGFIPYFLFASAATVVLQEVSIETEVFSAARPCCDDLKRREDCRPVVERVPSIPLPFRLLPFGFSPMCYLVPIVGGVDYAFEVLPSTFSLFLVGCLSFLLGMTSYLSINVDGTPNWSPSSLSDRLSSMGYYLPGEPPGESTERYLKRLRFRLAIASGLSMCFFSFVLFSWLHFIAPEGEVGESLLASFRLFFALYYFSDVADRARNYFEIDGTKEGYTRE